MTCPERISFRESSSSDFSDVPNISTAASRLTSQESINPYYYSLPPYTGQEAELPKQRPDFSS